MTICKSFPKLERINPAIMESILKKSNIYLDHGNESVITLGLQYPNQERLHNQTLPKFEIL